MSASCKGKGAKANAMQTRVLRRAIRSTVWIRRVAWMLGPLRHSAKAKALLGCKVQINRRFRMVGLCKAQALGSRVLHRALTLTAVLGCKVRASSQWGGVRLCKTQAP